MGLLLIGGVILAVIVGAVLGPVVVLAPVVWLVWHFRKRRAEHVQYMLEQYESAKSQLRQDPGSSQAREAMLKAGREYYSCMREGGAPTIYDEQAINNDMKAIIG